LESQATPQNRESITAVPVAEMSRPKRVIQQWLKEHKQWKATYYLPKMVQLSRQRVREFASATNWFQPTFWTIISEVAETVGQEMSPTKIVKGCQRRSWKLFHLLRADVVGKWIDRSGSRPCWSTAVLVKVAKGNCPGGSITRKGVLVSGQLVLNIDLNSHK
jgi:hypothetical protein